MATLCINITWLQGGWKYFYPPAWHLFSQIFFFFRIYKSVLAAVNKTSEGHPFKVQVFFNLYYQRTLKHKYHCCHDQIYQQQIFFYMGVLGRTWEKNCIFFVIRDKTFKHKYDYFHINQRCFGKKITWAYQGGPAAGKISIFFIIQTKLIFTGAKIIQ